MKYSKILISIILAASVAVIGCDRPSNKMENAEVSVIEANRDRDIAKAEVDSELRVYRLDASNRMTEYNRKISEIRTELNKETDLKVRSEHEARLRAHEETHRELKREIDNYNASSRDNWDSFQTSFNDRLDDLGDSLNDFFSNRRTTSGTSNTRTQ